MKIKIYPDKIPPLPIYPSTIGIDAVQSKMQRPEGYEYDEIFLVTKGSGILEIDGKSFFLEENDMFHLKKGVPHTYYRVGECFKTSFVSFFGSCVDALYDYYALEDYDIYPGRNRGGFQSHIVKLYSDFHKLQELSTLSAITYRCVVAFFDEACKKEYTPIEKVQNYLEANYAKQITLDDILSVYPYSKTKLSAEYKKAYGETIFDALTALRIRHARELIIHNPHTPLKNIAISSGYSDVSYFCKMYKRVLGVSPKSNPQSPSEGVQ